MLFTSDACNSRNSQHVITISVLSCDWLYLQPALDRALDKEDSVPDSLQISYENMQIFHKILEFPEIWTDINRGGMLYVEWRFVRD